MGEVENRILREADVFKVPVRVSLDGFKVFELVLCEVWFEGLGNLMVFVDKRTFATSCPRVSLPAQILADPIVATEVIKTMYRQVRQTMGKSHDQARQLALVSVPPARAVHVGVAVCDVDVECISRV